MSERREIVQLSLKPGSLDQLLDGEYASRFWLHRDPTDPDGVYRVAALIFDPADGIGAASGEALLRVLSTNDIGNGRQPAIAPPTPEVAEHVNRWEAWLGMLESGDAG